MSTTSSRISESSLGPDGSAGPVMDPEGGGRSRVSGRRWRAGRATIGAVVGVAVIVLLVVTVSDLGAAHHPAPHPTPVLEGSPAIPRAERLALTHAHAFSTRPVPFLVLGDSVALTLGQGLSVNSAKTYGVSVIDEAAIGCDLDSSPVRLSGSVGAPGPGCPDWRTLWPEEIQQYHPAVVGLLVGRFEVSDHLYDGTWVHVGEPGWDDHLQTELEEATQLLSAGGAKVVLLTMPFVDPPMTAPNGAPYPENTSARAKLYNALLRTVAASGHPKPAVIDVSAMLDPAGTYQDVVDGVDVHWLDRIHISLAGGEWLQPKVLPQIARLGLESSDYSH